MVVVPPPVHGRGSRIKLLSQDSTMVVLVPLQVFETFSNEDILRILVVLRGLGSHNSGVVWKLVSHLQLEALPSKYLLVMVVAVCNMVESVPIGWLAQVSNCTCATYRRPHQTRPLKKDFFFGPLDYLIPQLKSIV
jgi:hypothetical protein